VFHAVVSRQLGPAVYAEFSVLYALMIALSRPVNILSGAVTRVAVTGRATGVDFKEIKSFSLRLGFFVALTVGLGPVILSPLIRDFLKAGDLPIFILVGLSLFIWSFTGVLRGLFSSVEAFGVISYTTTAELFIRAVCGIGLVLLGLKAFGAIASSVFGASAVFILLYAKRKYIINAYNERLKQGAPESGFKNITAKVFFIALPVGFFLELDMLLVKRFFSPEDAGIYAAAALIGKGLLAFSMIASAVVYPKLIEERLNKKGLLAFLWGLGITVILFLSGYAFLKLFGKPVVGLLFGDKYHGVIELVPVYACSIIPLAVHLQIANFKGAIGGWVEGAWLWLLLAGYYLSLTLFSSAVHSYLQAIFIFHLIAAPLSFILLYFRHGLKRSNN